MHTTLFAAIMAGSSGKQSFSGDREGAPKKEDAGSRNEKTPPSRVPTWDAPDPQVDLADKK